MEKLEIDKKNKNKVGAPFGNTNCKGHKNAEKWTEEKALELGNELMEWMMPDIVTGKDKEIKYDKNLRNIQFNKFILMDKDLDKNIISELCKKYDSFGQIIAKAKEMQEVKAFELAIFAKKMNPAGIIFFIKTVCGRNEKSMIEHSGGLKIESKLSFSDIDEKIDESDVDLEKKEK